jgi:membrane protein YdbS with pleckstrin-like domain
VSDEAPELADAAETAARYAGAVGVGEVPPGRFHWLETPPREHIEHKHAFGARTSDQAPAVHEHDEIPDSIRRYLIPGEEHALAFREHWAALGWQAAAFFAALAAAIVLNLLVYFHRPILPAAATWVHVIWLGFLAVACWYAGLAAAWHVKWIVITPVRLVVISGILMRKVQPLPMKRVRDMQLERDFWGRVLGFGTLRTESLGTDHALSVVRFVPDPDRVYGVIWGILLPTKGVSPMPDEVN